MSNRIDRTRLPWVAAATFLAPASVVADAPPVSIADFDREALEQGLGVGVVAEPLPAPVLSDPELYAGSRTGSRHFRRVDAGGAAVVEAMNWTSLSLADGARAWRYAAGADEAGIVARDADGSFVVTGIEDARDHALTRYEPAEPLLVKDIAPGQEKRIRMAVRVYDLGRPDELMHDGALDVTYRYVGAYRLHLPAGTFDAILMKSTFSGTIGPAVLEDTQYRFFAPHAGLVAMIERRDVSALLVYNAQTRVSRVLMVPSDG
ncbi:MAG: hypothetical protein U1E83_00300 [Methylotetracoccus sp.]